MLGNENSSKKYRVYNIPHSKHGFILIQITYFKTPDSFLHSKVVSITSNLKLRKAQVIQIEKFKLLYYLPEERIELGTSEL